MKNNISHIPVMAEEVLTALAVRSGGHYLDGTVGMGGHAEIILESSGPDGRLVGIDWDEEALELAQKKLARFGPRVQLFHDNFVNFPDALARVGWRTVDGLLLDLGASSLQLEEPQRGFSFYRNGSLDMRMDRTSSFTLKKFLEQTTVKELEKLFHDCGERKARQISQALLSVRKWDDVSTTQIAAVVSRIVPRRGRIHPATRVFLALRIAVNRELENLQEVLPRIPEYLSPGGRIGVISFHSLEDRIVKKFIRSLGEEVKLHSVYKSPLKPSYEEIKSNTRSRSAKLRVFERVS